MKKEHGDSVLIGASSLRHIEQVRYASLRFSLSLTLPQNLIDLEKGPLRKSFGVPVSVS